MPWGDRIKALTPELVLGIVGGLGVFVITAGAVFAPFVALLTVGSLLLVGAIFARPALAIYVVIGSSAFGLAFAIAGLDSAYVSTGSFVTTIVGVLSIMIRPSMRLSPGAVQILAASFVIVAIGLVASRYTIAIPQALQGIRILMTPTLCLVIALSLRPSMARGLMRFGTIALLLSLIAALVQNMIGGAGLQQAGLEYGTNVRSIGDQLRAPGLFTTNYSMGAFAGVLGALALTWWNAIEPAARWWRVSAVIVSIGCLFLSTYRAGILVLVISTAVWLTTDQSRGRIARWFFALIGGVAVVAYAAASGLTSSTSLNQRFDLWERILEQFPFRLFGYGIGYAGSASGSRFASVEVVVDNYFLNAVIQFGIVGVMFLLVLFAVALYGVRRASNTRAFTSTAVLLAIVVTFLVVDFWEYTAAMSFALAAVAVAYRTENEIAPMSYMSAPSMK